MDCDAGYSCVRPLSVRHIVAQTGRSPFAMARYRVKRTANSNSIPYYISDSLVIIVSNARVVVVGDNFTGSHSRLLTRVMSITSGSG